MKRLRIEFVCTGTCGEEHPVNAHCKDCHHAEFKASVPYKTGKCDIWFNMLHGPMFYHNEKAFCPGFRSKLWEQVTEISEFGFRNCAKWKKKGAVKK